jgi:uncharacterized protein YndB with AHSA1/START domain
MNDRLIVSTRTIDFPRELVFKAWTDPAHLANWWGPKGFTNSFHEFDLKPGGKWVLTMHGPNGGNYENESVFEKIIAPELIIWNRNSKPLFRVEASFEASGNKTTIIFKMIFPTAEDRNKVINFVPAANEENFDRLEAELAKMVK